MSTAPEILFPPAELPPTFLPPVAPPKYRLLATELADLLGLPEREFLDSLSSADGFECPSARTELDPARVRRYLEARGWAYPFRVLTHINLKGGVGKTTASITLATRAAQYGFRTCIVDLDPQGSASLAFDAIPREGAAIFCDVWPDPGTNLPGALFEIQDGLSLLPSSLENSLLDGSLSRPASQKGAVAGVCARLRELGFDLVVVDCPPALGTAVISTICAADAIVIPCGCDPFSLKGVELTRQESAAIRRAFGLAEPNIRILYSHHDRRETMGDVSLAELESRYSGAVLPTVIRTSTDYAKALARRETIFACHRPSKARQDYDAYARRILGLERPPL